MTDLDGDGQLDLLLAHGESAQQPISVFKVTQVGVRVCVFVGWSLFVFLFTNSLMIYLLTGLIIIS